MPASRPSPTTGSLRAISPTRPELFAVNMFDVQREYPEGIVANEYKKRRRVDVSKLDDSKNVLICLVPDKYIVPYTDRKAKAYFTGKKFPSTVALNKLYYFMPYAKGKGIRDLYQIKVARVAPKHEFVAEVDENDLRIAFEIEYVTQLYDDYKPIRLNIWHTFTDTKLRNLII